MSEETLNDLLNDEAETLETEEAEETVETEEEETESTEEEEGSTSEPEEQEENPTEEREPSTEQDKAFYQAMKDERAKRQELERKLESMQAQPKEPEKVPDPVEDPEGYAKYLDSKNAATQWQIRTSISQEMMRDKHADYDEKEAVFLELAKENPALVSQLQASSNPAKFAYDMAIKHERMSQFDNFDSAVASEVEKQVKARLEAAEAEIRKQYEAKLKKAESLPPSGAKGSLGSDDTIPGNESLSDILGN